MQTCKRCGVKTFEIHKKLEGLNFDGHWGIKDIKLQRSNGPLEDELLNPNQAPNTKVLSWSLSDIAFWTGTVGFFEHSGLASVKELVGLRTDDLYDFTGVGPAIVADIKRALADHGLCLGMKV